MTIKTSDGNTEHVTSNGQGNLNTVLGAIGTVGTLMGGSSLLGGGFGNRYNQPNNDPDSNFVTRHELNLVQQLQAKDILLASKDSEIALQKANQYTDQKIVDTYTVIQQRANELAAEIRANKNEQQAVNAQQMAWNSSATGTMSAMATQIAALQSVTKVFIPSGNICQQGCGCCQAD